MPPKLTLLAPLSGHVIPIDQVPDPVFAGKLVGDGCAIDPLDARLVAPAAGTVKLVHPCGHAVTLALPGGVEVLMHIGLDTVLLRGEGFRPLVKAGESVTAGQPLIEFDADTVARRAKSLLTEIVIATPELVQSLTARMGRVRAGADILIEAELVEGGSTAAATGEEVVSEEIPLPNPTGMHARPAATLAAVAKRFSARLVLRKGRAEANAKSLTSVLALEIGPGDRIQVAARGADARAAVEAAVAAIRSGLGDVLPAGGAGSSAARPASAVAQATAAAPLTAPRAAPAGPLPDVLTGVAASPGLAIGIVHPLAVEEAQVAKEGGEPANERARLDEALMASARDLAALRSRLEAAADAEKAAIFSAHAELLEDPALIDLTHLGIERGESAAYAWREAYTAQAAKLAGLSNELLAARATDLKDVGRRVLAHITGARLDRAPVPERSILVAEDLTPSDTAQLDRARVLGFATTSGGATSHVAILARSLGIPAIAGIDSRALEVPPGTPAILDGGAGTLRLNPPEAELARIRARQEKHAAIRKAALAQASEKAVTKDGHRVEIAANIGSAADAREAVSLFAEGVGLLRTEFLFMERSAPPSEDEQFDTYAEIAGVLGPDRPLVIRTLDVGGDKPLPYLPVPKEENPFLGQRGLRLLLERPDVLRPQLRAILRASTKGKVYAMFPMIADLAEWRAARALVEEEAQALSIPPMPLGIMIEVPSAALIAEQFAREAAFFSIGSNDLTQYVLAMDRGHPRLAPKIDGLHPAVLSLIRSTVDAAHRHGRWAGVCGGIGGDAQAVPLLVGLGVDELSVSVPSIPAVKAQVRGLDREECRQLALKALECESAAAVRALVGQTGDEK